VWSTILSYSDRNIYQSAMKLRGLLEHHKAAAVLGWLLSYTIGLSAGALPIYNHSIGVKSSFSSVVLSLSCMVFWPTAFSISSAFAEQSKEEAEKKTGNTKATAAVGIDGAATGGNAAAQKQDVELPLPQKGMARFPGAKKMLFPLVGMGMGNLHANDVAFLLEGAPEQMDNLPLMIDTSHKSGTEADVAKGILAREVKLGPLPSNIQRAYHIVTKVWYTHLGYERTKLSVVESLRELKPVLKPDDVNTPTKFKVRITMLLHWPKCRDDFAWMECQAEEVALPNEVKQYPSPLAKPKAFLDSWRALEELFIQGRLDAIGISNFEVADLKSLLETAKIQPHIHQISLWSMYHDPELMDLMRNATSMVYQVYNVMQVFGQGSDALGAYRFMWELGKINGGYAPHTMGLAWMMQHHISVIPSTRDWDHLEENTVGHLLQIPTLNSADAQLVGDAIGCLMNQQDNAYFREFSHNIHEKEDLDQYREKERRETVETRFVNRASHPIQLFWVDPKTGERHPRAGEIPPGHEVMIRSHRDHVFHAYESGGDMNRPPLKEFQIRGGPGEKETFDVEL
jgi:diketogulonate reductase-like aldo/keto reductase